MLTGGAELGRGAVDGDAALPAGTADAKLVPRAIRQPLAWRADAEGTRTQVQVQEEVPVQQLQCKQVRLRQTIV